MVAPRRDGQGARRDPLPEVRSSRRTAVRCPKVGSRLDRLSPVGESVSGDACSSLLDASRLFKSDGLTTRGFANEAWPLLRECAGNRARFGNTRLRAIWVWAGTGVRVRRL